MTTLNIFKTTQIPSNDYKVVINKDEDVEWRLIHILDILKWQTTFCRLYVVQQSIHYEFWKKNLYKNKKPTAIWLPDKFLLFDRFLFSAQFCFISSTVCHSVTESMTNYYQNCSFIFSSLKKIVKKHNRLGTAAILTNTRIHASSSDEMQINCCRFKMI